MINPVYQEDEDYGTYWDGFEHISNHPAVSQIDWDSYRGYLPIGHRAIRSIWDVNTVILLGTSDTNYPYLIEPFKEARYYGDAGLSMGGAFRSDINRMGLIDQVGRMVSELKRIQGKLDRRDGLDNTDLGSLGFRVCRSKK